MHVYSAVGLDMSIMPHLPYTDFVTSSESNQIESYIRNTVDFSDTIQDGYRVCVTSFSIKSSCLTSACCPVRILF